MLATLRSPRTFTALLLVGAGLQVLDVLTTAAILRAGGVEANPLDVAVLRVVPLALWAAARVAAALALTAALVALRRQSPRAAIGLAAAIAALYVTAAMHNAPQVAVLLLHHRG